MMTSPTSLTFALHVATYARLRAQAKILKITTSALVRDIALHFTGLAKSAHVPNIKQSWPPALTHTDKRIRTCSTFIPGDCLDVLVDLAGQRAARKASKLPEGAPPPACESPSMLVRAFIDALFLGPQDHSFMISQQITGPARAASSLMTFSLPNPVRDRLKDSMKGMTCSRSHFIVLLIEDYLNGTKTAQELMSTHPSAQPTKRRVTSAHMQLSSLRVAPEAPLNP